MSAMGGVETWEDALVRLGGISAFRSAAEKIGGFEFVGYCECDPTAIAAYRTLYHTEGEYFCNDARAINTVIWQKRALAVLARRSGSRWILSAIRPMFWNGIPLFSQSFIGKSAWDAAAV